MPTNAETIWRISAKSKVEYLPMMKGTMKLREKAKAAKSAANTPIVNCLFMRRPALKFQSEELSPMPRSQALFPRYVLRIALPSTAFDD